MDLEKLAGESAITSKTCKNIPWFMYFCALTVDLLMLSIGLSISWFSPVLPQLKSNDSNINPLSEPITAFQTSLITVIPYSTVIMFVVWAKIIDNIGRKPTIRIICCILICGLIMIAFSTEINIYYVSLLVIGVGVNGAPVAATVYNIEISLDSNRGKLTSILAMHIPIGILIGYIFGYFTSVKGFTLLCTIPPVILLVGTIFIPETPYFLLKTNQDFQAIKTLERIRGSTDPIELELECKKIKEMITSRGLSKNLTPLDLFRNCGARKAFFTNLLLFLIEQLSGISCILCYVPLVFNKIDSGLSGEEISILVGVVKLVTFIPATYFIDKIGRKKLVQGSTFCCGLSMFFLGLYFYLNHISSHAFDNVKWFCILCVVVFVISYVIGLGTVPLVFSGEIYPDDLRATGVALGFLMDQVLISMVTFSFPLVVDRYGPHYCYWFFSISSLLGCLILYFIMPETKDKTLMEIQNLFLK